MTCILRFLDIIIIHTSSLFITLMLILQEFITKSTAPFHKSIFSKRKKFGEIWPLEYWICPDLFAWKKVRTANFSIFQISKYKKNVGLKLHILLTIMIKANFFAKSNNMIFWIYYHYSNISIRHYYISEIISK